MPARHAPLDRDAHGDDAKKPGYDRDRQHSRYRRHRLLENPGEGASQRSELLGNIRRGLAANASGMRRREHLVVDDRPQLALAEFVRRGAHRGDMGRAAFQFDMANGTEAAHFNNDLVDLVDFGRGEQVGRHRIFLSIDWG